jgi:hypothetical protein
MQDYSHTKRKVSVTEHHAARKDYLAIMARKKKPATLP